MAAYAPRRGLRGVSKYVRFGILGLGLMPYWIEIFTLLGLIITDLMFFIFW